MLILNSSIKLENETFLYRNLKSELDRREKEDSIELKNKLEELKADSERSSFSSNSLALVVFFLSKKSTDKRFSE